MKLIIFLTGLFYLHTHALFSQHTSRDNYTGGWETPTSWDPAWASPQTSISGFDISINGFITLTGSLTFSGSATNLIVNDTLVIIGNLTLSNNNRLTVNDNGILIIRGDLVFDNQTILKADGYIVVTRDIIKKSSINQGSFTSNDNPLKIFIGGIISKVGITNNPSYPVLNTVTPVTIPYLNSTYGFGNMIDIMNDPVYSFFQTTCANAKSSSNSPVCIGSTINLVASGGIRYSWSGPNGFISAVQNPAIPNANLEMAGIYSVKVEDYGCNASTSNVNLIINTPPVISITSNSGLCVNDQITLTGNPPGGSFILADGPGIISGNLLMATNPGIIKLVYNYSNVCTGAASQSIIVKEKPVAVAGPDQVLKYIFETRMNAELSSAETGEWSLLTGSGQISDINSPASGITELAIGENVFLWTVSNGSCGTSDEVKITVSDLFVPSVITPNGDGKNDYFQINALIGRVELIIFNRWGNMEYSNSNYLNDWDGRNNNWTELPADTYFYTIKFANGIIRKGTVLIIR